MLTPEQVAAYEASPEYQAKLQAAVRVHAQQSAAAAEALQVATPGALKEALEAEPITVGRLTLVDMTGAHRTLLERINSPYIRHLRAEAAREARGEEAIVPTPYEDEEIYESLFVLTRPPAESRALLRQGREHFRERALAETADKIALAESDAISPAIVRAFYRAMAPRLKITGTEVSENPPKSSQGNTQTASAGSLNSSPTAPASFTPAADSTGSGKTSP